MPCTWTWRNCGALVLLTRMFPEFEVAANFQRLDVRSKPEVLDSEKIEEEESKMNWRTMTVHLSPKPMWAIWRYSGTHRRLRRKCRWGRSAHREPRAAAGANQRRLARACHQPGPVLREFEAPRCQFSPRCGSAWPCATRRWPGIALRALA